MVGTMTSRAAQGGFFPLLSIFGRRNGLGSPLVDRGVPLDIHGMVFGRSCALIHHCTLSSLRSRKIQVKVKIVSTLVSYT